MRHVGAFFHATDIPPCYKCSLGKVCKIGGLWSMVGRDEERLRDFEITPDKFTRWEDCAQTVAKVERHARLLHDVTQGLAQEAVGQASASSW